MRIKTGTWKRLSLRSRLRLLCAAVTEQDQKKRGGVPIEGNFNPL